MSNDLYIIDEAAARSDMQKMSQAVQLLTEAQAALKQLMDNSETMSGQTGAAITEKAQELQVRIRHLSKCLSQSINLIQYAVVRYQNTDALFAKKFGGMN